MSQLEHHARISKSLDKGRLDTRPSVNKHAARSGTRRDHGTEHAGRVLRASGIGGPEWMLAGGRCPAHAPIGRRAPHWSPRGG